MFAVDGSLDSFRVKWASGGLSTFFFFSPTSLSDQSARYGRSINTVRRPINPGTDFKVENPLLSLAEMENIASILITIKDHNQSYLLMKFMVSAI